MERNKACLLRLVNILSDNISTESLLDVQNIWSLSSFEASESTQTELVINISRAWSFRTAARRRRSISRGAHARDMPLGLRGPHVLWCWSFTHDTNFASGGGARVNNLAYI